MIRNMTSNDASKIIKALLDEDNTNSSLHLSSDVRLALKTAINCLDNTIDMQAPIHLRNRLVMARVKNHYTLNESGYYIKIRKGTRVILDNATQEIYGITDSITLDILKGIVLEKE